MLKHWYNVSMEIDMNENNWSNPCPKYDCRKAACKCGLKYVNIPASLGDDSEGSNVAPKNGAYCDALVIYEANNHVYIYTKEGVPTLIDVDASDISTLEQEVRKAQRDIAEFREDIDRFAYFFDTVADMKASPQLSSGDYARTLGYYTKGDGGGAYYKISNVQPSGHYETMSGLLYAGIIFDNDINVKQLGAYGDDTHDDASVINYALTLGKSVYLPNATYLCGSTISLTGNKIFNCIGDIHSTASSTIAVANRNNVINISSIHGNINNTGVQFANNGGNTSHNEAHIGSISDVAIGILLSCTGAKGIFYNNIHFNFISATDSCMKLVGDDASEAYINENNFFGGRCSGGCGFKTVKGNQQITPFAHNKTYHVGFETIERDIDLEYAIRNKFIDTRTSEGVSGEYAIVCDADSRDNYFDCSYLEMRKINDANNADRGCNHYRALPLTDNGSAAAQSMRVYKGFKVFDGKFEYNQYASLTSVYGTTTATPTSRYYYNGMWIECGGDDDGTYVINLNDAFGSYGVSDFFLFVKNKTAGSTLSVKNSSGTTIVKSAAFSGVISDKLYHIKQLDRLVTSGGNSWAVISEQQL